MSGSLERFFAKASARPEVSIVVSERFRGDDGQPVAWRLRPVSAADMQQLWTARAAEARGSMAANGLLLRLLVQAVVYPDLQDAALQDSYGVMGAEELLLRMLSPGEYQVLLEAFERQNLQTGLKQAVQEAKN